MNQPHQRPKPPPVDYGRSGTVDPARWSPMPFSIIASGMTFATFIFFLFVLPRFEQIFKDFKVDLPGITAAAISVDRFMFGSNLMLVVSSVLWLLATAGVFVGTFFLIPKIPAPKSNSLRRQIGILACLLMLVIPPVVAVVTIFAPMIALVQSVSGPQGKK